jgi:hypothetical protein
MDMLTLTKLGLWSLCVPQLTQGSFLPKHQTLQNVFLITEIAQCRQKLDVILVINLS